MLFTLVRTGYALGLAAALAVGDGGSVESDYRRDPFRQLEELLPTPTATRAASGAPGARYWQQRADYSIKVELDERAHRIRGRERITYANNSPDELAYLWLQLDANIFRPDSDAARTQPAPPMDQMSFESLEQLLARERFDGGVRIQRVAARGEALPYTIVKTMMRVELPRPLKPGKRLALDIDWSYAINDSAKVGGRTGYERFDDGNDIFEIAQWFPRMVAYSDATGWQHKQFLGRGEFTLELGDYDVEITAPADHVVAATGELQNPRQVLSADQRARLERARRSNKPVFIVTPKEARAAERTRAGAKRTKTWRFKAEDVRDFAFASSRKFIWDAMATRVPGRAGPVLAMSLYPNEAEPLWSRYSTRAVAHTLTVYSRHTFPYPYPVAISVNGPVGGMEYPMICFNGPRPEDDGTYTERTKYGLISVVIHEVGHNFFPMIVNSDERQWTWMDEGLNTFLQFLAEQAWEPDYPSRRGEPRDIVGYMTSANQVPVMTNSESLLQFGNNAYAKPATALNILRETVLGRELFDYAFRVYARRWRFRRPMPADFFRTMEDASGVDLDWFWRG
ncbi:MAG: M1 family metallopeptidase, partial [Myxococcales bacterium]|nr:M1 family metallopeptidase [Myxococcales bacterium]